MKTVQDITGMQFGRLTAIRRVENDKHGHAQWECLCECGNTAIVLKSSLTSGKTKSCGCYYKDTRKTSAATHNQSKTRLFRVWANMHQRCENPNNKDWKYYGGKDVKVCEEWTTFEGFSKWALNNGYREDLTIDRISVDEGYSPNNCRWTSMKVQMNNTTRNHYITMNGETKSVAEWGRERKIPYSTLMYRLSHGWTNERVLDA